MSTPDIHSLDLPPNMQERENTRVMGHWSPFERCDANPPTHVILDHNASSQVSNEEMDVRIASTSDTDL